MRKILFVFAMVGVFVFSACQKEIDPIVPITCKAYEESQNGICVVVDTKAKLISDVFSNIDTFHNYTLDIIVQNQSELYNMKIEFDDNKSSFEVDGKKDYYMNSSVLEHYFMQGDQYQKEIMTQPLSENFLFFYNLDENMFTAIDDKYYLNLQNQSDVEAFFESEFPDSSASNFELTIEGEQISGIVFDLLVGEINYHIVMTFSLIGETSITIPVV